MAAQALFILCVSVLSIEMISAQCNGYGNGISYGNGIGYANGFGLGNSLAGSGYGLANSGNAAASSGGCLTVTSTSPIAPTGVSVYSDNAIEGPIEVAGQLPVLAAVGLEGQVLTNGAAGTTYGCGNGQVGISGESLAAAGLGGASGARFGGAGFAATQLQGAELNRLARPAPCGAISY